MDEPTNHNINQIRGQIKEHSSRLKMKFLKFKDDEKGIIDDGKGSQRSSSVCSSINSKIQQIKRRLNDYDTRENSHNSRNLSRRNEDFKKNSRIRTNSERSGLSTSSSNVGIQPSKLYNVSCNDPPLQNSEKRKRGSRGQRKARHAKDDEKKEIILQNLYTMCADTSKLNAETFLILDLLYLPQKEREEFLINVAKKKKILIEDPDTNEFTINPEIEKIKIFKTVCTENSFNEKFPKILELVNKYSTEGKKRSSESTSNCEIIRKAEIRLLFEDQVNNIVLEGLPEDQKEQFTFPRRCKKKRFKNYFLEEDFVEQLESFAQKCVEANLGIIVEGEIRVNAKNNDQAFLKQVDGERDAMFTSQLIRKCALHGDIVRAFIRFLPNNNSKERKKSGDEPTCSLPIEPTSPLGDEPSSSTYAVDAEEDIPEVIPERSAKGFVIKIIQEIHNRKCVGSFLSYRLNTEYITFTPRDMKMPNIRIYRDGWPQSFIAGKMDQIGEVLYVAKITECNSETVVGKILHPIGKCGELESENKAILLQNNLHMDPYEERFNEMFSEPLIITPEEIAKREDIRSECIFTIDPLTAKDLDDALSCKVLLDGNLEIGVHISDVSYFLPEESELDQIIKTKTTSVYMVNEVYHMLPKPLCFKCSLLPGEDKYAFSVFWTITPEAKVLQTRFVRTIMNSCTQLAYEHAQKIIDNPNKEFKENDFPRIYNGFTPQDIVDKVKILHKIATILRGKRFDGGSLKINRPKLYFDLNPDTGEPINYRVAELKAANYMIEEFMLLANQYVAKYIYEKFPHISILRQHDPPLNNLLKNLKEKLSQLGLEFDTSSSKSVHESFQKLVKSSNKPDLMDICLSHLFSKPMTRAKYLCSEFKKDFWHYALAVPIYTHFTSPIRRYPDILVHRVLSAALGYTPKPLRSPEELQTIANICNEKKYNAKLAGEDSANLYFLHYIKSKKSVIFRAGVLEIAQYSMEVVLIETGHTLRINYPKDDKIKKVISGKKPNYTAQLIFDSDLEIDPIELKIFSEIKVAVSTEKNKLKGKFVLPWKLDNNPDTEKERDPLICNPNANKKKRRPRLRKSSEKSSLAHKINGVIVREKFRRSYYLTLEEWIEMVSNCDTFKGHDIPADYLENNNAKDKCNIGTDQKYFKTVSQSKDCVTNSADITKEEFREVFPNFTHGNIPDYVASTSDVYETSFIVNKATEIRFEDTNIQNKDDMKNIIDLNALQLNGINFIASSTKIYKLSSHERIYNETDADAQCKNETTSKGCSDDNLNAFYNETENDLFRQASTNNTFDLNSSHEYK